MIPTSDHIRRLLDLPIDYRRRLAGFDRPGWSILHTAGGNVRFQLLEHPIYIPDDQSWPDGSRAVVQAWYPDDLIDWLTVAASCVDYLIEVRVDPGAPQAPIEVIWSRGKQSSYDPIDAMLSILETL